MILHLLHVLGWFVIVFCVAYAMGIQGEASMTGLDKFERAALALSILYLVGVSLVRW
jgi:hypothetical protein